MVDCEPLEAVDYEPLESRSKQMQPRTNAPLEVGIFFRSPAAARILSTACRTQSGAKVTAFGRLDDAFNAFYATSIFAYSGAYARKSVVD